MSLDFSKTQTAKTAKKRMVQAAAANTKDRIIMIPVGKLRESPLNRNMPTDNIEELANSIKENGLQEALLVYELDGGDYEIYAGHRRFIAMKEVLHAKEIPCISKKYPEDYRIRFKEHFINNAERRDNGFRYWLAEVLAARDTLLESGYEGNKRALVDEISSILDGKVSVAQIYRYEAMEKAAPSFAALGDLGYSVSMLYTAVSLNTAQQEKLAEIIREATEKNDGVPVSKNEFLRYVSSVSEESEENKDDRREKRNKTYTSKLLQMEKKMISMISNPGNEEEMSAARESIARIRQMLFDIEKELNEKTGT